MNVVFDTNILSTFAKINRLDLLVKLFDKQKLLIPTMVFKELQDSKQEFTQTVLDNKSFEKVNSTKEEKDLILSLRTRLGIGEKECIAICKNRSYIFVTNDEIAIKEAEKQGIEWLNLEIILTALKQEKIINEKELEKLIERNRNKRQNKDKKQRRFYRLTLIQSCLVASIRNSGVKISVVCCGGCPNLAFFNVC